MNRSRNITQRWFINNIGLIFIILLTVITAGAILLRSFYYNSARQYLSSKMNMVASILQNSYNDSSTAFSSSVRSVVENWADRDRTELMIITEKGEVGLTSSGFVPAVEDPMEDYVKAVEGSSGYYVGRLSTGEKVMALSILLPKMTQATAQ